MKAMQSFLTFFYILDQGYNQYNKDDLGGFLGAISPELWEDGQPADKAIFNDWQKFSNPDTVNMTNLPEKVYAFLKYYEDKFGYDFSDVRLWLLTEGNETVVEKAYAKAQLMYQKFRYAN